MPSVQAVEFVYRDILVAYKQAWQNITDEESLLIRDPIRSVRRDRLAAMRSAIERDMDTLDRLTLQWAQSGFPTAYALGGQLGAAEGGGAFSWTDSHLRAVQLAAEGVHGDLLSATKGVRTTTKDLIKRIARDRILNKLITGETAVNAGQAMAEVLKRHGISAVVYQNGTKRGLDDYSEMVMRTATGTAYNVANLTSAADNGVQYWEIFDGPNCGLDGHGSLPLANGLIVSIDDSLANPLSHPNCTRSFGARPDLSTKKEAQAAGLL